VRSEKGTETLPLTESDGRPIREEVSVQGLPENIHQTTENSSPAGFYCGNELETPTRTMVECRILEPVVPILNNNTCRICGQQRPKKDFRKIWSLRNKPNKEIRLWCRDCQKLWKGSRPMSTGEVSFVVDLD
jgi:hypothetical protein